MRIFDGCKWATIAVACSPFDLSVLSAAATAVFADSGSKAKTVLKVINTHTFDGIKLAPDPYQAVHVHIQLCSDVSVTTGNMHATPCCGFGK